MRFPVGRRARYHRTAMPAGPDSFKYFRAARWTTEDQLAGFVAEVSPLDPADPDLRLVCCRALVALQATSELGAVAALLEDEDADVRLAALAALSTLGAQGWVAEVEGCSNDPDPRVRTAARDLATRWAVAEEPSTLRRFLGSTICCRSSSRPTPTICCCSPTGHRT